ncbi:MAG: choice-of-anchor Q domain-containing protein [Planctomycetota bacterium]
MGLRTNRKKRRSKIARALRLESLENRRLLAAFVVNNLLDGPVAQAGDLPGSLRQAIFDANANPGADTIEFEDDATSGTITLTDGELQATESLEILGPGFEQLTIDGDGQSRVLHYLSETGDLTVDGLTLTGGRVTRNGGGAGINSASDGTLSISNSRLIANISDVGAGGISTRDADVVIHNSTISDNHSGGNGGAVSVRFGDVTIIGSTLRGNTAGGTGGAIITSSGSVSVLNSTVSSNTAGDEGGGIRTLAGDIELVNSTVFNNQADVVGGGVLVNDSVINASIRIDNSIVAGNTTAGIASDIVRDPGGVLAINHSLIGNADDLGTIDGNVGNLTGTEADPLDPMLGELADNGGPTQTHALLAGSPAFNSGSNGLAVDGDGNPLSFDQRGVGFDRIAGATVDMGALEKTEAASLIVTTDQDIVDSSDGMTSLREAIAFANLTPGEDTITFDASLAGSSIVLNGTELLINDSLIIDASALISSVTIDADGQSRVLSFIDSSGDLTIDGLNIVGGSTAASGGGIHFSSQGTLEVNQSSLFGNSSASDGGGVSSTNGEIIVTNSTISGNSADRDGGGIDSRVGDVLVSNSTLSGNMAVVGGAIHTSVGDVTLIGSTLFGNSSEFRGGGVGLEVGAGVAIRVESSIVAGNTVGGVSNDFFTDLASPLTINHSLIGNSDGLGAFDSGVGNLTGNTADPLDPLLGELADNGGRTPTHALLPGSPAIDAGDNALAVDADGNPLAFDQRGAGFGRIVGGTVDIGAVEFRNIDDPDASSIRIDNDDPGYLETGVFRDSSLPGFADSVSRFSSDPDATVTYSFADITPGFYRVTFFSVRHPNSTPEARLDIVHNGRTDSEIINQQLGSSGIVDLGVHEFSGDGTEEIVLSNVAGTGNLRADAVTLTPVPTPVIFDVDDPEYSEATPFSTSSISGFNGTSSRFSRSDDAQATYDLSGIEPGFYEVSVFVVTHPNSTTAAEYTVHHAGAARRTTIDQSTGLAGYVSLGVFEFDGTGTQFIDVQKAAPGILRTDAAILSPVVQSIDNDSSRYSEDQGEFRTSSLPGHQGTESRFSRSPDAQVTYRPSFLAPGNYRVEYFNIRNGGNTNALSVEILHEGRSDVVIVDSQSESTGFVDLGTFTFDGSTDEFIRLTNASGEGILRADAVRLIPILNPELSFIDNDQSAYSEVSGEFANSNLRGFEESVSRFSGSADASVFYDTEGLAPGTYLVEFFTLTTPNSTTAAELAVTDDSGTSTVVVDQAATPTGFVTLGTFAFDGKAGQGIELTNGSGRGRLRADAVRFTPTSAAAASQRAGSTSDSKGVPGETQFGDVNEDGAVSALDALLVINQLAASSGGEGEAIERADDERATWEWNTRDVNWDGSVTPLDALTVINALSRQTDGKSEPSGEQVQAVDAFFEREFITEFDDFERDFEGLLF